MTGLGAGKGIRNVKKERPSGTKKKKRSSRRSRAARGESRRLVFKAATRSEEFFDHLRAHYREAKRRDVDIKAEIRLVGDKDKELDHGTARVANVSPSGALLEDIRLSKEGFPTKPFRLAITMKGGEYDGIGLTCRPVRLVPEKIGMGVAFEEIFVSV